VFFYAQMKEKDKKLRSKIKALALAGASFNRQKRYLSCLRACFNAVLKPSSKVEAAYAGRAYAAYGGIYIVTSIAWLAVVERIRPLGSDWLGVGLCVIGATIILLGPRFTPS